MKFHKIQMLQFPPTFMTVHETSQKSNASIFSNFYDPGYTKPHKNQILQFSLIFMTPGRQNFTKIKCFNFLQFSWTRVDEISQNSNASISSNFQDHTRNFTKIKFFNFLQFSWPWVHETSQKSNASIFSNFHDRTRNFTKIKCFNFIQFSWPRVHKIHKNQMLQFNPNLNHPRYTKLH